MKPIDLMKICMEHIEKFGADQDIGFQATIKKSGCCDNEEEHFIETDEVDIGKPRFGTVIRIEG